MTANILIYIFIFALVWTLSRYGVFLISSYRSGYLPWIRKQSEGLVRPLLRAIPTAMAAEALILPSHVLWWCLKPESVGDGTPVVLVHGLYHNASAWLVMRRRLKKAGYGNLHTYQYNSFTKDFDTAVDGLAEKLDQLLGTRPDGKVVLIGHSLGGLVCRRVAGDPKYNQRVACMVALGSPHRGSELAWFGGNRMARDLIPGRRIPRMVEEVPDPACPKLAIYSLVDDFVFPLPMLQPGRPGWQERVCSPMGHVWMLYSREVADMVIEFLRAGAVGGKGQL